MRASAASDLAVGVWALGVAIAVAMACWSVVAEVMVYDTDCTIISYQETTRQLCVFEETRARDVVCAFARNNATYGLGMQLPCKVAPLRVFSRIPSVTISGGVHVDTQVISLQNVLLWIWFPAVVVWQAIGRCLIYPSWKRAQEGYEEGARAIYEIGLAAGIFFFCVVLAGVLASVFELAFVINHTCDVTHVWPTKLLANAHFEEMIVCAVSQRAPGIPKEYRGCAAVPWDSGVWSGQVIPCAIQPARPINRLTYLTLLKGSQFATIRAVAYSQMLWFISAVWCSILLIVTMCIVCKLRRGSLVRPSLNPLLISLE
jgi:hypothetical protein